MKVGPKYKIARRLGAPVFEKTQTQKFALSQAKKTGKRNAKHMSQVTDYGIQVKEKQKARFTYLLTEKQFSMYVKKAIDNKGTDKANFLFGLLESRLDNVVFRIGLAPTRSAARQMTSHGHIMVDGGRVTIPSYQTKIGNKISIRPGSLTKKLFADLDVKLNNLQVPEWIKFDNNKKEAEIIGIPNLAKAGDQLYDLTAVLEFYSR